MIDRCALLALAFAPLFAHACQFPERTEAQIFAQASSIFRARVIETHLAQITEAGSSAEVIEARVEVREVLKGVAPKPDAVVRDMVVGIGNCGLGLLAGFEYVFVPGQHNLVWAPSGSFGTRDPGAQVRLESFRVLAKSGRQ